MSLSTVFEALGLSQRDVARASGLSQSAVSRMAQGVWPVRGAAQSRERVVQCLRQRGASDDQLLQIPALEKLAPASSQLAGAAPEVPATETTEEKTMLLPKQTLSAAARKKFGLFTNPFGGDVTSDAEMFVNGEINFVREAAWQAAVGGRLVAIVGESGAGKTTILDDLKEQVLKEHKPLVFVEPSVDGMEDSDTRGKSIKVAGIQTAIILTLDPNASVAQTDEKRARQVKRMLEESTTAGRSHLLIIEEAHSLPIPTLKHLKRLHERLRLGRRPMLGILLLGHPELEDKLNRFDAREVMQRCEVARLCPLGADLSAYLQFRASNAGRKLEEFISADGVDELKTRLTISAGDKNAPVSLLYPLNVNNWMAAALNTAAGLGAPRVDRDVVRAV